MYGFLCMCMISVTWFKHQRVWISTSSVSISTMLRTRKRARRRRTKRRARNQRKPRKKLRNRRTSAKRKMQRRKPGKRKGRRRKMKARKSAMQRRPAVHQESEHWGTITSMFARLWDKGGVDNNTCPIMPSFGHPQLPSNLVWSFVGFWPCIYLYRC